LGGIDHLVAMTSVLGALAPAVARSVPTPSWLLTIRGNDSTLALIALALLVVRPVPIPSWSLAVRVKDWVSVVVVMAGW